MNFDENKAHPSPDIPLPPPRSLKSRPKYQGEGALHLEEVLRTDSTVANREGR